MGINYGIDGVSASTIFLMCDGVAGGVIGIILTVTGGGYSHFIAGHIVLGIISGAVAGIGVICLNISISTGIAGPAFAIANVCSVIQAFADWGFLGQEPTSLEWLGLVLALLGATIMSIGDDYLVPKRWR